MNELTAEQSKNFRHLYHDIFWWGILAGSTLSFTGVYLARLGANSLQMGLLTAGPAVVSLFLSLPAGYFLRNRPMVRITFASSVWHRISYLVLTILPIYWASQFQVWFVLLLTLLASIPGTVVAISFNAMFADVVPPEHRPQIVGRRNALLALSMTLSSLLSGYLLDTLPFPLNYQFVFGIGVLGAGLSSYHLSRLRLPSDAHKRIGRPLRDMARIGLVRFGDSLRSPAGLRHLARSGGRQLLRFDLLRGPFGIFLLLYFFFYFAQNMPAPLFALYMVQELGISDGIISLGSALFYLTMLFSSTRLNWFTEWLGLKKALRVSSMLYSIFPIVLGLSYGPVGVIWAHVLSGAAWGLTNGSLLNNLMDRVPQDDRPAHMALHHVVLNLGVLGGSLAGPLLAEFIGIQNTLLSGGALRFVIGLLMGL